MHKLVVEKRKLEVILESVEDGVLVLSAAGDVMLVSHRMLSLLGLAKDDVQGKPWRDLSTSAPNYMALRDGLRDDMQGKQEITLRVGGEERIYAGRRRSLLSGKGTVTGQVPRAMITAARRVAFETWTDIPRIEDAHAVPWFMADLMARRPGWMRRCPCSLRRWGRMPPAADRGPAVYGNRPHEPFGAPACPDTVDLVERVREWLILSAGGPRVRRAPASEYARNRYPRDH
ncbi:MAG: PAS domain-containing protein [Bilophila wadsworthia]